MSYLQESIINSIHEERHREADLERLSGASRLPGRRRHHTLLIPSITRRASKPGATFARPAA